MRFIKTTPAQVDALKKKAKRLQRNGGGQHHGIRRISVVAGRRGARRMNSPLHSVYLWALCGTFISSVTYLTQKQNALPADP